MMKFICHNITCLIEELYEHNIQIYFNKCSKVYVDQKVPYDEITRDAGKVENEDF